LPETPILASNGKTGKRKRALFFPHFSCFFVFFVFLRAFDAFLAYMQRVQYALKARGSAGTFNTIARRTAAFLAEARAAALRRRGVSPDE